MGRVVYSEEAIRRRVQQLGEEISRDYEGLHPILVSVLKGAIYFVADLTRSIRIPIHLDFLAISRYGQESEQTGVVRITKDLDIPITGRHVLMIEDVIDTGLTLRYLLLMLERRQPASLYVCTLLDNRARRLVELPIRYRGFAMPDEFLVGYGLDWREDFRHLPYLAALARTP
ncbi:MAG: hypoxanthine phosphoribosyltransferase [Limnochordaceae bacterium]|nr:hypoxanthine phosphoribosyltransferase [Limnochordaceae bacterium]